MKSSASFPRRPRGNSSSWLACLLAFSSVGASACHPRAAAEPSSAKGKQAPAPLASGLLLDGYDRQVSPSADLFQHANGQWLRATQIPTDKSDYGAFTALIDEAERDLRAIVVECAEDPSAQLGSERRKIGDLYRSFMDEGAVDSLGVEALRPWLKRLDRADSHEVLLRAAGALLRVGVRGPIGYFVAPNPKNAQLNVGHVYQSGLGLPDRDYYVNEKPKDAELVAQYQAHLEKLLSLAGMPDATQAAKRVVELERAIARLHWTQVRRRNRDLTYNERSFTELTEEAPELPWLAFFEGAQIARPATLNVRQPDYLQGLSKLLANTSVDDFRLYLKVTLLRSYAELLSAPFAHADFDFYARTLNGQETMRARWKRAVEAVEESLGEALGRIYVARHFQPEAKARMDALVHNLRLAFADSVQQLTWMSDATKAEALAKLEAFTAKIGYPQSFRDYSSLDIQEKDLVGNLMRARAFEHDRKQAQVGKPVDPEEWLLTPQSVNAYYSASRNEIVFPAAILQPPFFDPKADDAVNYGAIGGVIGHELSHGFDDQGRKSDGAGNLRDWWTAEDAAEFKQRAQLMVEQYDQFRPFEDAHVDGELTLSENIGDLGGLTVAYRAYERSLGGKEPPELDGYTGRQRFFLGWAQIYRRKHREADLRRRLVIDPHAPSRYRVNGIVANMPEFYAAFGVKDGDPLWRAPELRVKIW